MEDENPQEEENRTANRQVMNGHLAMYAITDVIALSRTAFMSFKEK